SSDRDAADPTGGHRVSMASAGVRGVWRGDPRPLARGRPQWQLWSPSTGDRGVVYGGVSLVEAHDATDDGGGVWRADERGADRPMGAGHDGGGRRASGGSPHVCASAGGGPPRRDQLASRGQARLVMGGGDEPRDGVCGAAVPWGPGGP